MDKKKVKKKKTEKTTDKKKREKRDQKKEADGSERELRVESSRRKEQKTDIPSSLYAPLALSPKEKKKKKKKKKRYEQRVFACRAAFCVCSFFARRKRMRTMSNHLGIARRVARVARAVRFWMRNESIRRLRGGGGLLFALPPREEKTRGFGRVANEARGKIRENCAEMCVLRAKTHIVRAVLEWTRSYAAGARCGLSRRGFSKTGFESAFSTTHTRRPRFFFPKVVGIIDAMRFTNTSTHAFFRPFFHDRNARA